MEPSNKKLSQEDLIKILEFVCKNKNNKISPNMLRGIFPNLDVNEISSFLDEIKIQKIPVHFFKSNRIPSIKYRDGLEEYVKNLKKMTKKQKLHKIVEFLSTHRSNEKQTFESGEIAKAFSPELSIYEVNGLCELLIANEDVYDVTTNDSDLKSMVAVLVTTKTHNAYHNKRYLDEEDDIISIPIHQNISGKNIIVGNISGTVNQEDSSITTTNKTKGKTTTLNKIYWIIGIVVGLTALITFILKLL